jgi:hypothetical protein
MKKILSLLIALIILMQPVLGAELSQKKADDKPVKKDVELEQKELKESQKEFKKSEFKYGDEKAKSKTDIKLKTEKRQNGLKISAENPGKGSKDKHDILIAVEDIPNFNYKNVRIDHYSDTGTLDARWIQEVNEVDGYVLIPDVEFSSIIVDGFTGTKTEVSFNVNVTDTSFTVTENASLLTITLDDVPDGVEIDENDSSTYPSGAIGIWNFNGNSNDLLGINNGTDTNITYINGTANFNGIDSKIIISNSSIFDSGNVSVHLKAKFPETQSDNYQWIFSKSANNSNNFDMRITSDTLLEFRCSNTVEKKINYNILNFDNPIVFDCIYRDGNSILYVDSNYVNSVVTTCGDNGYNLFVGGLSYSDTEQYRVNMQLYELSFFHDLNETGRITLDTGYSGTSAKLGENGEWQPVINGTVTFDNVTAGETIYLLSADDSVIATSLTKEYVYTQDYTLIEESETTDSVTVQINATAGANMSESQLVYDVASSNFTYNMSISSDNSNVTGTYHNGTVTLDTGLLNFGDSFNYTLTFDKLAEGFTFWTNWISKTSTKAVVEYKSSNSNVENDFYLENMTASSTFDFKYSNGTILANATSDSDGYLKFDDVGGVTDTYKLINDTYTIEKQTSATTFVAVVFTGLSFVGLYFANRFRRR